MKSHSTHLLWLVLAVLVTGCTGTVGRNGPPQGSANGVEAPSGPKRVAVAILGNPYTLSQEINSAGTGSIRGVAEMEKLIHMGLAVRDGEGNLRPGLAEAVPTVENGHWRVMPDGRMETTWKIHSNTVWHDGAPVTTADLVFTLQVGRDRDLPLPGYPGFRSIEGIDAPDAQTVTVRWNKPFIEADTLFTSEFLLPRPKHLLEAVYSADKAALVAHPFWTTDYVGAGPFKVREFVRDSHMTVEAFDRYVLGRPKLDQVLIRFIQDPNVVIANVLSGEVEVTIGRGLNLEQVLQVASQWPKGRAESSPSNWIAHYPQLLTPDPAVIGDVRFRRALLQALDREGMSEALQAGQAPVADAWLEIGDPQYKDIEPYVVKYSYDPRAAIAAIQDLGYAKGADGFFRNAGGQKLTIESRTNAGDDVKEKMVFSSADYWQRIGVGVDPSITPRQLASDREYRATFPGFDLVRQPFEPERLRSSQAALPENRFNGKNRTRYQNPELDSLIDRYLTTIPRQQRIEALGQMMRLISDQVVAVGIFYAPEPKLIANRVINVKASMAPGADETWNAHLWDVR